MYFSQTSSPYGGIIQNIERETKLGLGTISGNTAPDYYLAHFTVLVNNWNNYCNHMIQSVSGEWTHDDGNNTGFPIETYSTTDDQQDHGLDSDIRNVRMVEMHDANEDADEGWFRLEFQPFKDREADRFGYDSGTPSKYWLSGGSVVWDVPVDTDDVDYYRITYDRQATAFEITDTTQTPGFLSDFHPILVYGPSWEWAQGKGRNEIVAKCEKMLFGTTPDFPGLIKLMKQYYGKRATEFAPMIARNPVSGGSWE